jgi:O-antigen/teichoic acid export membrane protein
VSVEPVSERINLAYYSGGSLFKTFVQIVANLIMFRYVNPADMGVFNSFMLFQTYALLAQAGIINGLNRELPYTLGKGDGEKALLLISTALIFSIASCILIIVAGSILYVKMGDSNISRVTIITVIILTVFRFYESYLNSIHRAYRAFAKLGKIYILRGLIGIITIPLVILFHYEGYIFRIILATTLMLLVMHLWRPVQYEYKFRMQTLLELMKTGLPIFALAYFYQIAVSSDRLLLAKMYGAESVGFYSFGLMAYSAFKVLSISLAEYIYPKFSYAIGNGEPLSVLWGHAWRANVIMFVVMLAIALLAYFLIPWITETFFAKYSPGINSARVLLFAAVFSGSSVGSNLILSLKRWRPWSILQVGSGIVTFVAIYGGLAFFNDPLVGASVGVFVGQGFYFFSSNIFTYMVTHG